MGASLSGDERMKESTGNLRSDEEERSLVDQGLVVSRAPTCTFDKRLVNTS